MKILIANHWLKKWGGSETFTYTMVGESVRQGHITNIYTLVAGIVSEKILEDFWVKPKPYLKKYDLILANHHTTVTRIKTLGIEGKIINTCHGTIPRLEIPSTKADKWVSISEEVQNHITRPSVVIRNGIDCKRFRPINPINNKPKTVLSMVFSEQANKTIKKACDVLGLKFLSFNKHKNPIFDIENEMNKADIVIGLGRCIYEAMACGRNVIVYDARPYMPSYADGYLNAETLNESIKFNCSGRRFKKQFDYKDLVKEIQKYNTKDAEYNLQFANQELNIEHQFRKYLDL